MSGLSLVLHSLSFMVMAGTNGMEGKMRNVRPIELRKVMSVNQKGFVDVSAEFCLP